MSLTLLSNSEVSTLTILAHFCALAGDDSAGPSGRVRAVPCVPARVDAGGPETGPYSQRKTADTQVHSFIFLLKLTYG